MNKQWTLLAWRAYVGSLYWYGETCDCKSIRCRRQRIAEVQRMFVPVLSGPQDGARIHEEDEWQGVDGRW